MGETIIGNERSFLFLFFFFLIIREEYFFNRLIEAVDTRLNAKASGRSGDGIKCREIKEYLRGDSVGAARVSVVVDGEWLYLI